MYLRDLELDEFRSFRGLRLGIDPSGFRALGANGSGKSTLLEAIAMLSTTRSPRTSSEREIAHWDSGSELSVPPYARLRGRFERRDGSHEIELRLTFDAAGQGPLRKQARYDQRAVRAVEAIGQFKTVLFGPQDVELLSGPPAGRRRYLDVAISQASRDYLRALSRYGRVLEQRNSLLRTFVKDRVGPASQRPGHELPFWSAELVSAAVEVLAARLLAVQLLGARAREHYASLTGNESLALVYHPARLQLPTPPVSGRPSSEPSIEFRQALAATLAHGVEAHRGEELRRGVTAVGPHRDDFVVTANGVDLGRFGSRGQQRLAVVAVKLAELDLLEGAAGEPPTLLLDDVLSELDGKHRQQLVTVLASRQAQICVTATDLADLDSPELRRLPLITIRNGSIVSGD